MEFSVVILRALTIRGKFADYETRAYGRDRPQPPRNSHSA